MNSPFFSIIVPVYNVEKYLERCLNSIFEQNFSGSFEVIAVDDCSTDGSLKILQEYKKKEPRLNVIEHEVNKKLSCARDSGLKFATGEYILHVDSDDWLLPGALENLHIKCQLTNADVIVFDYVRQSETRVVESGNIKYELITEDKNLVQKYFFGAPWNKAVRRILICEMVYGAISINSTEDLVYCTELLLRAKCIYLFPKTLYAYFVNNKSITSTVSSFSYLSNQIVVLGELEKVFDKYDHSEIFKDRVLSYFEKFIYFEFFKIQNKFIEGHEIFLNDFIVKLSSIKLLSKKRLLNINKASKSQVYSFFQLINRYGVKFSIIFLVKNCLLKSKVSYVRD